MGYEDRHWFPCYGKDLLTDKELQRCPPESWGMLLCCMCLSHQGHLIGYLTDSEGTALNFDDIIAPFAVAVLQGKTTREKLMAAFDALVKERRVQKDNRNKAWFLPKMVRIGQARRRAAEAGSKGGNPVLLKEQERARWRAAFDRAVTDAVEKLWRVEGQDAAFRECLSQLNKTYSDMGKSKGKNVVDCALEVVTFRRQKRKEQETA